MLKVPGKIQGSLWQRNSALHRRGVKTPQEHKEGMFRTARNKTTTRISNSRVGAVLVTRPILPKNREQDSCSAPLLSLRVHPSLHHLPSGILQEPSLAPHPAMLAWHLGKGCSGGACCRPLPKRVSKGRAWLPLPPSVPALPHASHLPCLLSLATTKKFVGIYLSLRLLLPAGFGGNELRH